MSLPHPPSRPCLEPLEDRLVPASLPPGFFESAAATGLTNPTAMEFSPDGRLFVLEQAGTAQVWQGGARLSANFFAGTSLNASSVDSQGERGLLGIAFDPAYSANHFVYVYYTAAGAGAHNRVSRFTADPTGLQAVPGSEKVLLELDPLTATNHNGGAIHFGPDGMLYVGVGDGGNTPNKAQDLTSLFGKVLRLDVRAANVVPPDNPFVGVSGARGEVWALGLRNPFTFTVQPGTGRIFVNDVGLSSWEEIDNLARGANYGWPATEGNFDPASFPGFTEPFYTYPHPGVVAGAPVTGGAITGGAFYDPATSEFPADYSGDYFFADFVSGWVRRIDLTTHQVSDFASGAANPVDLRVSADGALYYLARGQGEVFRVDFAAQGSLLPDGTYGTPSQRYVAALYRDLLGRPLTLGEMQDGAFGAWVSALAGWSNAQLVAVFENTAEARTFALDGLYRRYLGRPVDGVGQNAWLPFLAAGGTYEQVEAFLVSSPEFLNARGGDLTAVLDAIYRSALDRPITAPELANYADTLARGTTLGQVAQGVMGSAEHHFTQVVGWYQRFLLRTPAEDVSGWGNALLAGRRDELVVADMLGAPGGEYYDRVIR